MNDIIEIRNSESNENNLVHIDDTQLDLYFKMHKRINQKNEEISKSYKNNILVNFSDIDELHDKVVQSIRSSKPLRNSIITQFIISHHEGEAERFKSFDDFKTYNITSPNPTTEITMTYRFNILDGDLEEVESYKVTIGVRSRIGELHQFEQEAPAFISSAIISSMVTTTARIKIEYSDYVKARHFMAMFDEWIKGCDESKESKIINALKKVASPASKLFHLTIICILGYYVSDSVKNTPLTIAQLAQFLVLYSTIFYVISSLTRLSLANVENAIESYLSLSYLQLNKGDTKLIKKFKLRNGKTIAASLIGIIGSVTMGVISSGAYDAIKELINR